ncbi:MAG: acyl carrier protein [Ginsengibacter sp.]
MKLHKVLKDSFNVSETEMSDDVRLMSYGEWDSMSHMFFITKLEEAFEIELTGDEIADMQTIGDIKKLLISKGKEV